ncbi:MAG: hypothetical protein WA144_02255 [Candidatus Methanoperedens sp.]
MKTEPPSRTITLSHRSKKLYKEMGCLYGIRLPKGARRLRNARSEQGRVKMERDCGNEGAEAGGRVPMKEDDLN